MGGRGASSGLNGIAVESQSGIKSAERNICRDKVETAYLFDKEGKVIFSTSDNEAHFVCFNKEQVKMLEGNVLTHNHPSGSTFSYEDVTLLTYHNMQEIRAAVSNGTFSLAADKNSENYTEGGRAFAEDYKASINLYLSDTDMVYARLRKDYNNNRISIEEFENSCDRLNGQVEEFRCRWLEKNSFRYGYHYKFQRG